MRKIIKRYIYKLALKYFVARRAPDRVVRSGSEGENVRCFAVHISKDGTTPYLYVQGYKNGRVLCLEWDGGRFSVDREVKLDDVLDLNIQIVHYYGLWDVKWYSIWQFLFDYFTRLSYIKIFISKIDQHFFNKTKLITKRRMELLQYLVDNFAYENKPIDAYKLMTALYSVKWYSHPKNTEQQGKIEFYLESLVESGEINKINNKLYLNAKSLRTIEEYEEEERRHTENVKIQRGMLWITLAVFLLALVQAEIIKVPVILDLSKGR